VSSRKSCKDEKKVGEFQSCVVGKLSQKEFKKEFQEKHTWETGIDGNVRLGEALGEKEVASDKSKREESEMK